MNQPHTSPGTTTLVTPEISKPPRKRHRWMRVLGALLGLLLVAALAAYWAYWRVPTAGPIVYADRDSQKLYLDVYYPPRHSASVRTPAVIVLFGGGWRERSRQDTVIVAQWLARLGLVAVNADYRMVTPTSNKYPTQIDDVQQVVRWTRAHAAEHGIDPERIGALGVSSGGHLAAFLGLTDTRPDGPNELREYSSHVRRVVVISAPMNLADDKTPMSPFAMELVTGFIGQSPAEAPELYRAASPINHIGPQASPFLILHSTADFLVPVQQAEQMHMRLRAAGVRTRLLEFEGKEHGYFTGEIPIAFWMTEAAKFLRE